jgi:hypothetical protein
MRRSGKLLQPNLPSLHRTDGRLKGERNANQSFAPDATSAVHSTILNDAICACGTFEMSSNVRSSVVIEGKQMSRRHRQNVGSGYDAGSDNGQKGAGRCQGHFAVCASTTKLAVAHRRSGYAGPEG